jgi:biopolymer transport protein ExbB
MTWLHAPLIYWSAGGVLLLPLAGVCFGIWFYFLRSRDRLLSETALAGSVAATLEKPSEVGDRRSEGGGPVAAGGGVAALVAEALAADSPVTEFEEQSGRLLSVLRRDLGVLKALTVVAPLLGLLGTVMGMISTFDAVAGSDGDTARRVAEGVSRALITTQVGLVVAIPGVFGTMHLRRLLSRLQVQLGSLKLHVFEITGGSRA